jgi:uncharacterized LabA/DUF88 family protein
LYAGHRVGGGGLKTILYIDGFNLYYSAVKATPLRWLNPVSLVARAFPRNQIVATKYFTARVTALPNNPGQPIRQLMFWRALQTLPQFEIIEGDFRTRKVMAAVVAPPPNFIQVLKTEEKGSDVNLAAHLLLDGFRERYECAIIVSGDSDLVTPIRMVRDELKKPVGVLNPQRLSGPNCRPPRRNAGLQQAASFYQNGLSWAQLKAAQFPATLSDANGTFHKPPTW